ncbi:MAG: DUF2946 family protein [Rubrivivax sp.]
MDDIVKAALRKWPNVPHCYGWLALDARGNWFMRDDRTQAAGPFPQAKGSRIEHRKLIDFIERNTGADDRGNAYFQNGPQRVYLELEAAPWVWRLTAAAPAGKDAQPMVHGHDGQATQVRSVWLDEQGRVFLDTELGFGLVHTLDMETAAAAVEAGVWQPQELSFSQMPGRFGYVLHPQTSGT